MNTHTAPPAMTVAEARAAGLLDQKPASKKKASPRGKDPTRCHKCGELCPGETAEKRHNEQTGHARFEWPL